MSFYSPSGASGTMQLPSLDHMYSWGELTVGVDCTDDELLPLTCSVLLLCGCCLRKKLLDGCLLLPTKPPSSCIKSASSSSGDIMDDDDDDCVVLSSLEHPKSQEMPCRTDTFLLRKPKLLSLRPIFCGLAAASMRSEIMELVWYWWKGFSVGWMVWSCRDRVRPRLSLSLYRVVRVADRKVGKVFTTCKRWNQRRDGRKCLLQYVSVGLVSLSRLTK